MIRNRPSAFGHQPSAIGTFHHSARAMSSHPPNDSESAFSLRPTAFGHQHLPSFGACDVFTSPQ
ncbi:unnamed protein product [Prunus armeniaca]